MNNSLLLPRSLLFAGAFCLSAASLKSLAEDFSDPLDTQAGWFARAGAAARFNLKAKIDPVARPSGPGVYDDGSVLPDISGPDSGLTWNWSYQSASQVAYDANSQPQAIVYHLLENVPSIGSQNINLTSPVLEGEVVTGYRFDDFQLGKRKAHLAFEIGYGYFSLSEGMSFQASGIATETINSFRLWGVVPPVPPYAGTFEGPGPLIDLYPDPAAGATNVFATTTTFQGSLKATFHNFRFGPAFGIDLSNRLNVQLGAGYDSLYTHATWQYSNASAYTPTPSTATLTQTDWGTQWRSGVYAEILANFRVTKRLQAYLGGDFQYNNNLAVGDSNYKFTMELGSTYAVKGGLSYSF